MKARIQRNVSITDQIVLGLAAVGGSVILAALGAFFLVRR